MLCLIKEFEKKMELFKLKYQHQIIRYSITQNVMLTKKKWYKMKLNY